MFYGFFKKKCSQINFAHQLQRLNIFEIKKLPLLPLIVLSFSFCGFVLLTNLSLAFNSVGFYQVTFFKQLQKRKKILKKFKIRFARY